MKGDEWHEEKNECRRNGEWLLTQGATPVTEEMKKEPWYAEVSKLPPCLTMEKKQPKGRQKNAAKR